ncbi:MAG: hypothetical protein OXC07_06605 [Kistimonas sp.]|nr:hypothetical protein [Kistimonas sp.]
MRPASSATYRTLEIWRQDCDSILEKDKGACPVEVGQDGRLKAGAAPAGFGWRALSYAGRLIGRGNATSCVNTGLIKQHISQLHHKGQELCKQLGIKDRTVLQATNADTASLAVQDLKAQLDRLLDSPGTQLARVHEHLDNILDMAHKKRANTMEILIQQLPPLLAETWHSFRQASSVDDAENFRQFSVSLSQWMNQTHKQLKVTQQFDSDTGAAFKRLEELVFDRLHALDPAVKHSTAGKTEPAPDRKTSQTRAGEQVSSDPLQYQVWDTSDGRKYISLTPDQLSYGQLCDTDFLSRTDFQHIQMGAFRVDPRAPMGPLFKHDAVSQESSHKWRLHLSIDRRDLESTFLVLKDWIMDPANKIYQARIINQNTCAASEQKGTEVTLYLMDDEAYENRDTGHWQNTLADLETALTLVGVRPGAAPESEGCKFFARINGSRFLFYRNDGFRLTDTVDSADYEERVDTQSNLRYFQDPELSDMPVVLLKDFNTVPPAKRFHLLPQGDPDFLADVQLGRVRSTAPDAGAANMKPAAFSPEAPPPRRDLPQDKQLLANNLLKKIEEDAPALKITQERLLNLLRDPVTGEYDLLRQFFPAFRVIRYLQLQQAKPDSFPDADFHLAYRNPDIKLYPDTILPAPGSAAFQDWVNDSAEKMEASRAARHAMKQWAPQLEAFMPEHARFQDYLKEKIPEENLLEAISGKEQELIAYGHSLHKELYMHLRVFGPDQMNREALERIFTDCCERLLLQCIPGYAYKNDRSDTYIAKNADWQDPATYGYSSFVANGLLAHYDTAQYERHHTNVAGSPHKFRISVHPHDYEKAWPLVAEILHRKDSAFLLWQSTCPGQSAVMREGPGLSNGGQFTLHAFNPDLAPEQIPPRCQEANIASTLNTIENCLHKAGIRPGVPPFSDVPCGRHQSYVSYHSEKDEAWTEDEPGELETHDRRRDSMNQPCYQNVSRLLDQQAVRQGP